MSFSERSIEIAASPSRVWDVLTLVRYIEQWDDVPGEMLSSRVSRGDEFTWEGYATLTFTELDAPRRLYADLRAHAWAAPPKSPVGYEYCITPTTRGCRLAIRVGDFSGIPDGEKYREASDEFVVAAANAIKRLAEASA